MCDYVANMRRLLHVLYCGMMVARARGVTSIEAKEAVASSLFADVAASRIYAQRFDSSGDILPKERRVFQKGKTQPKQYGYDDLRLQQTVLFLKEYRRV